MDALAHMPPAAPAPVAHAPGAFATHRHQIFRMAVTCPCSSLASPPAATKDLCARLNHRDRTVVNSPQTIVFSQTAEISSPYSTDTNEWPSVCVMPVPRLQWQPKTPLVRMRPSLFAQAIRLMN